MNPIELYNGEVFSPISAPGGVQMDFFVELDQSESMLTIETFSGSGDLLLTASGMVSSGPVSMMDPMTEEMGDKPKVVKKIAFYFLKARD